ncbi:hypothetical protein OEZ49_22720, partial [Ruegeria sp. WL0004]
NRRDIIKAGSNLDKNTGSLLSKNQQSNTSLFMAESSFLRELDVTIVHSATGTNVALSHR